MEMKLNLQIGNFVKCYPSNMPIRISAVHNKKVAYHTSNNKFAWVRIGLLQGIDITPEFLERNGFVKSHVFEEWKYESDDLCMIWKPFPFLEVCTEDSLVRFPCEYVHELQNALLLCGIEKKIEL